MSVVDSEVSEAYYLSSGEYLSEAELRDTYSIDGLFQLIIEAHAAGADELDVAYNDTYGYPESIVIDFYRNAVDDEVSYTIKDFHQ